MRPDAYIVHKFGEKPRLTFYKPDPGTYSRVEHLFKRQQLNKELKKCRKELRNAGR